MTNDLLLFIAIGFAAQMVDGAIGMAYGITATTALLSMGVAPSAASAAIHTAEVFTTAASGTAHWQMGNVDRRLVVRLAVPGAAGAAVGAYVLATVPGGQIRQIVSVYLLAMGGLVLWRAFRKREPERTDGKRPGMLGLVGGFLDAIGGGGWGAVVTTRRAPALRDRIGQRCRVFRHVGSDGRLCGNDRLVVVADHRRSRARWHPRSTACRGRGQAYPGPAHDDAGRQCRRHQIGRAHV